MPAGGMLLFQRLGYIKSGTGTAGVQALWIHRPAPALHTQEMHLSTLCPSASCTRGERSHRTGVTQGDTATEPARPAVLAAANQVGHGSSVHRPLDQGLHWILSSACELQRPREVFGKPKGVVYPLSWTPRIF